ncbi:TfoX/Sxy family protein [Treponema zuelzerae]|uniref:TfoX/Sxy family protein n=1 Tax=Teretinema zuelzerae TaxID=156 RepID=A0AAE3EFS7_9SPIR|nr:TfoX/Sxy family protein [Teretinema zuelzerae]MCD1653814.1 TfoX/Sxy family protein [Teretinema zuelzerae]
MSTSVDFIEFAADQAAGTGAVRYRKMFGEYMLYVDDRPLLLVCDNVAYVKIREETASLLADAPVGPPYAGAKDHYILDIENRDLVHDVIRALLPVTPIPVKKSKKKKED